MNDVIDVTAVDSDSAQALKTAGWVSCIPHRIVRGMLALHASRPVGQ